MKSSLMSGKSPLSGRGITLALTLAILIPTAHHEALAKGVSGAGRLAGGIARLARLPWF